jgi:predicted dehydrogenase
VKAAVIGCGRMGAGPSSRLAGRLPQGWLPHSHVEALIAAGGFELAICDTDAALLETRAREYGVSCRDTDFRRLLGHVRPELVTVATRTPPKAEIVDAACDVGARAVYIEKPFATNLLTCRALLARMREAHVIAAYGVNRRYHSTFRVAHRLVADGAVGMVTEVVVEPDYSAQLMWSHPHSVDTLMYFAGSMGVERVRARFEPDSVSREGDVIDCDPLLQTAVIEFDNGVTGHIARASGSNVRIAGTRGSLTILGNGAVIHLNRFGHGECREDVRVEPPAPRASAMTTAFAELAKVIRGTTPANPLTLDPEMIETGTRILLACAWSGVNGQQFIDPRDVPPTLTVTGRFNSLYP